MNSEYDYSGLYGGQTTPPAAPETDNAPAQPQAAQPQAPQPANADAAAPAAPQTPPAPAADAQAPAAPAAATQAQAPAQPQAAQPQAAPAAYPNVGSSGINTANTARTDYTDPYAGRPAAPAYGQGGYGQNAGPAPGAGANSQYTNSMGGNGGYNGYSYTSAPQKPPRPPRKKGGAKKVLLRLLAGVLVVALGFAGGFGGAVLASRLGLAGQNVIVQQVQRPEGTDVSQGSAEGNALSLQDVSAIVAPSVVVITTEQMVSSYNWFGGGFVQSGAGSGVIMSEDGYVLTCAHVVSGAQNITVTLNDGKEYDAAVVGADNSADIAVIKIEATGLTPAVMGDSDALAVGETVVAVGNPLGMLGGTVTNGIISAINREVRVQSNEMTLIQTNAAISPGNSGGGLFNANGELIGIVNAKSGSADSSGNLTDAEGLGFAIPINSALDIAQDLIDVGYVKRPALGITVITVNDVETARQYGVDSYGVYVYQVNPGSGAEAAGLKVGDRIAAVEDVPISENDDLTGYLEDCEVGDTVTLQIEREGHLTSVEVTLGVNQG